MRASKGQEKCSDRWFGRRQNIDSPSVLGLHVQMVYAELLACLGAPTESVGSR